MLLPSPSHLSFPSIHPPPNSLHPSTLHLTLYLPVPSPSPPLQCTLPNSSSSHPPPPLSPFFILFPLFLYSLCIIYLMVAIGNWISVSVVAVIGPKVSLIVTGFLYV